MCVLHPMYSDAWNRVKKELERLQKDQPEENDEFGPVGLTNVEPDIL